jgi:hypothetical protein
VLAWIALICAGVLAFEVVLELAAIGLFPHVDTPECASTNTFCFPDGHGGVTGGAMVVGIGNLVGLAVVVAVLVVPARRRTARAPRDG